MASVGFGEELGQRFNVVVIGKDLVGKTSLSEGLNAFSMAWQKLVSKGERVADLKSIQKALKDAASLLKKRGGSSKSSELTSPRDAKDASHSLFHQTECDIHAYGRSAQNTDLHLQLVNLDFRGRLELRSAHSFFYPSERVLFLVVWSLEDKDLEDTQVERWISYVRAWRPEAPILVVGTNMDKIGKRSEMSASQRIARMKEIVGDRFPGIEDVFGVCNPTLEGFDVLIDRIFTVASAALPEPNQNQKLWKLFGEALHREVELLESLNALPTLRWDKVAQTAVQTRVIASAEGEHNMKKLHAAIDYLASIGALIVIYSAGAGGEDSGASSIAAVSTRLEFFGKLFAGACTLLESGGAVKLNDFQQKHLDLRSLVREEDWQPTLHYLSSTDFISPSLKKDFDYLVPSMFSIQKPENVEEKIDQLVAAQKPEDAAEPERCRVLLQINYMPDGLFSRMLARTLKDAECNTFWRNGAIFILESNRNVVCLLEWRPDKTGIAIETTSFSSEDAKSVCSSLQKIVENVMKSAPGVKLSESRLNKRSSFKLKRSLSRNEEKTSLDAITSPRANTPPRKVSKQKKSTGDLFSGVTSAGDATPPSPRSGSGSKSKRDPKVKTVEDSEPENSSRTSSPARPRATRAKSSAALLQGPKVTKKVSAVDI